MKTNTAAGGVAGARTFRDAAEASLAEWTRAFGAEPQPWQREGFATGKSLMPRAVALLNTGGAGAVTFETTLPLRENAEDEEYHQTARCWSLTVATGSVTLRRWLNHASIVGAEQQLEFEASGKPTQPVPTAASDWLPSLVTALQHPRVLPHASASGDAEAATQKVRSPSVSGWRGWLLVGVLFAVGLPLMLLNNAWAGLSWCWGKLARRKP